MKCEVLIDYFTFTVHGEDSPRTVIEKWLAMDPDLFEDPGYGLLGYNKLLRFNNIFICYDPRENTDFVNLGICVSMSGKGCRAFESMSKLSVGDNSPFEKLFEMISADVNVNVTRVDIACDDKSAVLDMDTIIKKVTLDEINSRVRKRSVIGDFDGKERIGATVYIGSKKSDFFTRIYDKAAEQDVDGHWIRVELVLKSDNANAFVDLAVNYSTVGRLAAEIINDKFSFIVRDDSNISRCTVCDWWREFVGSLEEVKLVSRKVIQNPVEDIADWYEAQVGPSAYVLLQTLGFDLLLDIAYRSEKRLSDKQRALITDWRSYRKSLNETQT